MNYHFSELSVLEYANFENNHPQGNFVQSAEQKSLLEKRGENAALVGLKDDTGKVVAGALVTWAKVKLGNLFSIERGLSGLFK